MRLVVIDTNVIVSAGIRRDGPPAVLIHEWVLEDKVKIVTCPGIIREYHVVTWREKFRPHGFPPVWLEWLIGNSLQLSDPAEWPLSLPDSKDAIFLALASAAGAWLVTGNLKDFPKSARRGVTVIAPADYLAHLAESQSGA